MVVTQDREVGSAERLSAWKHLLAKLYELDIWACLKCGRMMVMITVILDPVEIRKIISCLAGKGRAESASMGERKVHDLINHGMLFPCAGPWPSSADTGSARRPMSAFYRSHRQEVSWASSCTVSGLCVYWCLSMHL